MSTGAEPGTILGGKYRVEEVLGVGGMGVVVAAHHLQLDQKVAIKYLLPEALGNPQVVERFAREARAAAKIRGEHVVRVLDVGQFEGGGPYMVMEHLQGHDLAKELETNAPLRIEDVARYVLETCEALSEAHSAQIVHRDLKPGNLFLASIPGQRAIVKVLDFGISKVASDAVSSALTNTSALMGTAFYMSPEQLTTPKSVDHRSDIWALGVILYELLAGVPPFTGETVAEVIAAILTNEPKRLVDHRADVPPALGAVIANCLRTKVADRYPDVASLAFALAPFASPQDRKSAEISARVLGVTPGSLAKTEVASSGAVSQDRASADTALSVVSGAPAERNAAVALPAAPGREASVPELSAKGASVSTQPSVGVVPVTAHAMSRGETSLDIPKSRTPVFALSAAGVASVALVLVLLGRASKEAPRAMGVVSAPASESVSATELSPLPSAPTDVDLVLPTAGDAGSPLPVSSGVSAAAQDRGAASSPPEAIQRVPDVARPSGTGASKTSPVASSTAPPAPVEQASTPQVGSEKQPGSDEKKNPLQMGIK